MKLSFCAGSSTSEQGARRIALERHAQFVDFVEEEHRILRARLLHALNDSSGHRADVRAPVSPNVRLVSRTTEGDADVLADPSERAIDFAILVGLSHAGRSYKECDRAFRHRSRLCFFGIVVMGRSSGACRS